MTSCDGETITVQLEGDADAGYDALVTKAMARVSEFLPGVAIHRREADCGALGADHEEWYLACGHSDLSLGGTTIGGTFTFLRHG